MARFWGFVRGKAKTAATRLGTEKTGLGGSFNGWNIGVSVNCFVDNDGKDIFYIYKTGGSNDNTGKMELIAIIKEGEETICAQQ